MTSTYDEWFIGDPKGSARAAGRRRWRGLGLASDDEVEAGRGL